MFYQPKTVREALERKAELKERGPFIAGGTDLVVLMNAGKAAPENFIDLTHVKGLNVISRHNGTLELAGNVTHAQCGRLPVRCLARASLSVGGPGIRELGTIAGNLATASPAGDGSTALLALDAEVELSSVRGTRRLPLDKFFLTYRKTALAPDEMITKIFIPTNYQSDWAKNGKRGAVNISVVAAAVALAPMPFGGATVPRERDVVPNGDSRPVAKQSTTASQRLAPPIVRIALASVAPTPMRCYQAEQFLTKNGVDTDSIRQAVEIVRGEIKPITDHRASADYKTHLAGVMVRRLLENLVKT